MVDPINAWMIPISFFPLGGGVGELAKKNFVTINH